MREHVTTLLDALGLVAVAAGVGAGAAHWVGWFGAAISGGLLLAGSALAHWQARPPREGGGS